MNLSQRKQFVKEQISKLYSLLEQWEKYQVSARDPGEKEKSKTEIERIKKLLVDYESEQGGGIQVDENLRGPLIAPAIRSNNRKWIIGILLALILIVSGYFIYLKLDEPNPDYNKYLSYLNQGDSLVIANKYPEAKAAYKKSLRYNPGDSAVIKKISYLKKADELIAQNKFEDAKQLFKIVIEIAPSPVLASQMASNKTDATEGTTSGTSSLQFTFEWKDGVLIIRISGGIPYTDKGKPPYIVEGLNCKDCIQWAAEKNSFTGRIQHEKVTASSIQIKDSKGSSATAQIPAYNPGPAPVENKTENQPTNAPAENKTEADYKTLVEGGDKKFSENKFVAALEDYQAALTIKPSTKDLIQKIEDCKKRIEDEKLNAAKNIPKVNISGGSFTMGTENGNPEDRPEHTVKISPFSIGKTEVTVAQYKTYCSFTNKTMPAAPSFGWIDENPVTNLTWEEAKAYCTWVGGRLPTEAEWEYAAKESGTNNKTYSGSNDPGKVAVYKDNSGNKPSAVGKKQPNSNGIYDMTGNVFEWCADWFGKKYYATAEAVDPKGPSSGREKVIRGGAFNSSVASMQDGNQLRMTYRNSKEPSSRETYIGFRVLWER